MIKIYLDMCSLQRPLDDKSQLRIALESQAILGILSMAESRNILLMSSDALMFETRANPNSVRREFAEHILDQCSLYISLNSEIERIARSYIESGIKSLDALHLASAVIGDADFFCSCDDRLIKKARTLDTGSTQIKTPLELATEIEQ